MSEARTALVTGASRGIGKALVLELTRRDIRVFASGRDAALLEELHRETGCGFAAHDLGRAEEAVRLYQKAKAHFNGTVEILVNNAGFNDKAALVDVTLEEFDRQFAVNLRAPFLLCREAGRDMKTRGRGHILNVVSTSALFANEGMGAYSAMKAGLGHLTKILAKELRPHGVKVTAVFPGGTDTEFRANARPDYLRPETAAKLIADVLFAPEDAVIHELVFRPMAETNF
jgi:NAD(P)-dependent dehydrogenase (short-subunit alcohol dehydrogenase family)